MHKRKCAHQRASIHSTEHKKVLILAVCVHMQTFPQTPMHMQTHKHKQSGWTAQQCPLQAAISMEIVLIVPIDHTSSSRRAGLWVWMREETLFTHRIVSAVTLISAIINQSLDDYRKQFVESDSLSDATWTARYWSRHQQKLTAFPASVVWLKHGLNSFFCLSNTLLRKSFKSVWMSSLFTSVLSDFLVFLK